MRDIAPKVLAHNHMPRWAEPCVQIFLNLRRDVLLDGILLQRRGSDVDHFLLHVLFHIDVLDHGFGLLARCGRLSVAEGAAAGLGVLFLGHDVLFGKYFWDGMREEVEER